jgi:hypothetical protein
MASRFRTFFITLQMLGRTHIPIENILIEDDGFHLVMNAKVNGKNVRLLIDTGASRTVFDLERLKSFVSEELFEKHDKLSTGLGTDSMPTSTVEIRSIRLGDLTLKNFPAVLLDLQHVNGAYHKLGHDAIDGVLGNDVLVKHKAIINYKKMELTLGLF